MCLQGGAGGLAALLEGASPSFYLMYLLAAGFGLPVRSLSRGELILAGAGAPAWSRCTRALKPNSLGAHLTERTVQCSEDALVVWVGSKLWLGHYGSGWYAAGVLLLVYAGVVLSDYVRRQALFTHSQWPLAADPQGKSQSG